MKKIIENSFKIVVPLTVIVFTLNSCFRPYTDPQGNPEGFINGLVRNHIITSPIGLNIAKNDENATKYFKENWPGVRIVLRVEKIGNPDLGGTSKGELGPVNYWVLPHGFYIGWTGEDFIFDEDSGHGLGIVKRVLGGFKLWQYGWFLDEDQTEDSVHLVEEELGTPAECVVVGRIH